MTPPTSLDSAALLDRFAASLNQGDPIVRLSGGLIGQDATFTGPFGPKTLLYADYVASGRALTQVEDFVAKHVLPYYANSHTESSFCGAYSTRLRAGARATIARLCGADNRHAVIFCGAGATAGLNRLVTLLGASEGMQRSTGRLEHIAALFRGHTSKRARVIIGPYEHHSNILPWRESGAEVVEIGEAADGGPDLDELRQALAGANTKRVICAFSAASNITGIITDVAAVTRIVKAAGALMVWDYAGAGPYLPISMTPAPGVEIDAIAISPHKFIGGPGASGVLIVRCDAVTTKRPVMPGGGTVKFVSSTAHDYVDSIEEREEPGTPNSIGDVRAALAFLVKDAIGPDYMARRNGELATRAIQAWQDVGRLELLGSLTAPRLPIFSFLVRDNKGAYINPQLVTRILSDKFGIQARGGCACAGPYAHRLLSISPDESARLRQEILSGRAQNKPGFTRLNLSVLMPESKVRFIIDSIANLASTVAGLDNYYSFDADIGIFQPRGSQSLSAISA